MGQPLTSRRSLWWALAATLGLTVLARFGLPAPPQAPAVVAPAARLDSSSVAGRESLRSQTAGLAALPGAPAELAELTPARIDPFAPPRPNSPPAPAPAAPAPAVVPIHLAPPPTQQAAPSPAPTAPRFAGRMLTPDGQMLVFLRDGEQTLLAKAGAETASGYRVEAVDVAASASATGSITVKLLHMASQQRELLLVPMDNR